MKTLIKSVALIVAGICISVSAISQDNNEILLSKKGTPVLPRKGEFAVGISANPFFTFAGNIMNVDYINSLDLQLLNNSLYGKYFLSDKSAVRFQLRTNISQFKRSNLVVNDLNPSEELEDHLSTKSTDLLISTGYEKRKGNSRLQISYGGEILLGFRKYSQVYDYANKFSSTNMNPTTTINFNSGSAIRMDQRPLKAVLSNQIITGIRGFLGIEYFFLPKISIGTELGLKYVYESGANTNSTVEYWDYSLGSLEQEVTISKNSDQSQLTNDILNGQIILLFYF